MALTVSSVITEFGNYYRNEGQGVKDILKNYYQPSETFALFNPVPTENTQERRVKFLKNRVLQRYQKAFTPVGGGEFKPSKIDLAWMKVDELEIPDDLEKSYLGFMNSIDSNDVKSYPFVRWYMEHILKQVDQDFELNEIWSGVEGVITPGTATAAGASMNGLAVQIADGITATEITPIAGPASWSTDPATFVTEVETWVNAVKAVSNEHRIIVENELDYLVMSKTLRDRYADGLRAKYNVSFEQVQMLFTGVKASLPIKNSNIKVVGVASMTGSNRIWMTPMENRAGFSRKPVKGRVFGMEPVDRSIKLFGDIWKGAGFWYKPYVFVNQLV